MERYLEFAKIYDELINADIDYSSWADTIIKLCQEYSIDKNLYLDLACGTANMTMQLGRYFKQVYALDLSEQMLSIADDKLRLNGIKPKLICQDICDFNLNKQFDLITCCLDSTNYILDEEDLILYLKCVFSHLTQNGIFVFDINTSYKLSNILGNNTFTYDSDEIVYIWENAFENNIVDMYLTFFVKCNDMYKRFNELHSERAYSESEIEKILYDCSFEILTKMPEYKINEQIKINTERITYVVKKKLNQ